MGLSELSASGTPARKVLGLVVLGALVSGALLLTLSHSGASLPSPLFWHKPDLAALDAQSHGVLARLRALPHLVHVHPGSTTANALLQSPELGSIHAPIAVVVTDGLKPERRGPADDFLAILCPEDVALRASDVNAVAMGLEAVLGRRLYPVALQAVDFCAHLTPERCKDDDRPYVIWDASSGQLLMDRGLLASTLSQGPTSHMAYLLARHLFREMSGLLQGVVQAGAALSPHLALQLCVQALAVAIPAAFAAAPPLWFCILCPAVLGLVAPLAINFGLGEVASIICGRMQLTDEQCFDLMMGAIGLGFVLSLATAIPIFLVCRLMECAHRNTSMLRLGGVL